MDNKILRDLTYGVYVIGSLDGERKVGCIANSVMQITSNPASKYAVNGITKSLARELGKYNIRVNAVAPGITETDMVKNLPKEMIEPLIKTIPLGRIGKPEDVANAFLFLASDMASYVTGEILSVDGAAMN